MLSLLLLAAGALAADPYFLLLDLSALSPLLRYSPLPGQNTTADQWTAIENITDGTGSSDMPMRLFGGASVSFSMPAGVSVWVYGDLSGEAAVTVDGEPADASIVQTQNIYVRWLTLEVPGGVGPHNVSVTVKGNASVSAISGHRQGNGEICLSSTGPHDRCFEGHFEGWGSYKPITATLTGSWLITDSKIAVTRDPGASALMQVPSNASWVEIEGWNSGSYEVRCMPTPPNSTAGAITYNGYVDMSGRWKPDLLYAAELDPHIKYAVEITHRSNTTAVRQMQSWVYVPKPKSNLSLGIGIGVGVGMVGSLKSALMAGCAARNGAGVLV
ncbi:unnamed protein product [Cutaneotrichosporon oleaginosum]